jgi:predicted signal transduction protein with EAL and GGDEF domain
MQAPQLDGVIAAIRRFALYCAAPLVGAVDPGFERIALEFIVIMPGAPKNLVVERATQLCHKLHDVEVYYESKKLPSVTASFGVSYLPGDDYKQAGIIVKLADTALYAAKRAGRDQVIVYDSLSHVVGEEAVQGSGYVKDLQDTI